MSKAGEISGENWLIGQWADEIARTLHSMTDARPTVVCAPAQPDGQVLAFDPKTLHLEVTFSLAANAQIWIAVPPEAAHSMGDRILKSAGIDDSGPEEIQNTCLEVLQQAHAGLAQAISSRIKRSVSSKGREVDNIAATLPLFRLEITYSGSPAIVIFLAVAPAIAGTLEPPPETESVIPAATEERPTHLGTSKTFEVLLDVSMPVSVSFGRTQMPIKEVLKLTTGSIVELNRALTEPVEVIINDRVIARGEVVVVDGNYGVRILHIVSRQERFQSTTTAAMISKSGIHQ